MLPLLAANVQGPCKSCWVVFSSSSSPKLWGSRAACAVLLNGQWCRLSQPITTWCRQEQTDVNHFCMENIFSVTPASPSGCLLPPQVSELCSGEQQTNMVKSRDECSPSRAGQPSMTMQQKNAQGELGCPRFPLPTGRRGWHWPEHISDSSLFLPAITYPLCAPATSLLL